MRILFDQGTPVPLRKHLAPHEIVTAFAAGWSTLSNGEILARAEEKFDVLVTTDQQLRYQQNIANRKIAIVVLPYASGIRLERYAGKVASAIAARQAGDYIELSLT